MTMHLAQGATAMGVGQNAYGFFIAFSPMGKFCRGVGLSWRVINFIGGSHIHNTFLCCFDHDTV